ncbi:hypothetical protein, partial [Virgibacillus pantothenticus]|uniref:hypothetical protein n=1 Tax=Virgibacillus pantothenticus TaxID=1473 RepID=UPI001BCCAB9D
DEHRSSSFLASSEIALGRFFKRKTEIAFLDILVVLFSFQRANLLAPFFTTQLLYYTIMKLLCQQLFSRCFSASNWRLS